MKKYFRFISVLVLLILGVTLATVFANKYGAFEAMTFFIAYLGLVLSLLKEYHYANEGKD